MRSSAAAAEAARWERPDIYKGTRGEALMAVDGEELRPWLRQFLRSAVHQRLTGQAGVRPL